MCGRYEFPPERSAPLVRTVLQELMDRGIQVKTGTVLPGDKAAVLASSRALEPRAFGMRWGYTGKDGKRIINARSETAAQRPMFADGMRCRRVMVPAQSYYEWEKTPEGKRRYTIRPREGEGFYLAGLYRLQNGIPEFVILTRQSAPEISFIHDRMPVILPQSVRDDWLNPRYRGDEILCSAETEMVFFPEERQEEQLRMT